MSDDQSDLLKQFEQFLAAKKAEEDAEKDSEDFELEIWDEKGRGVRTKRSHAKPFLQSLGIDVDAANESDNSDSDTSSGTATKNRSKSTGPSKSNPAGTQSVARKYFVKGK